MSMSERRKLPKVCDCGGQMIYGFGPGNYVAGCCSECTPVVIVRVPGTVKHA